MVLTLTPYYLSGLSLFIYTSSVAILARSISSSRQELMEITTLSGATLTKLHEKELAYMVENGHSVRENSWRIELGSQDFDKDS